MSSFCCGLHRLQEMAALRPYNHNMPSAELETLTRINLDDLTASFGWEKSPLLTALVHRLFRAPAEKFARWMLDFDAEIQRDGLPAASCSFLRRTTQGLQIDGREYLPASGPTLILSNHPGMTDTLCLFAAIGRADLRIIALNRPFLRSLPNISRHLFYVSEHTAERMRAVKQTVAHLRAGGCVLTFPAGKIEPDPDVYPGALASLEEWTASAGIFLRFVPEIQVVPALVRGVLWEKAVKHPLTRLKSTPSEREKLGAAFQLLAQTLFDLRPVSPVVHFGRPLCAADLGTTDPNRMHSAILAEMRRLLQKAASE